MIQNFEDMCYDQGYDYGRKLKNEIDHMIHQEMKKRGIVQQDEREAFAEGVWDGM